MSNPYEPPKFPRLKEAKKFDEDWLGRECFGWAVLLISLFYILDSLLQVVRRYSNILDKL